MYAEVVHIRPKSADAVERLLSIRDELVRSYRDSFPGFISCRLLQLEDDGSWLDLWFWRSKAEGEEALAQPERTPLFAEWGSLVEMVRFQWAEVLTDH